MCRKARHRAARAAAVLLLALCGASVAQDPPAPEPAPLAAGLGATGRLKGPIKITAQRAELENRKQAVYRGNVKLTADDLTLTGDRLELKQPAKGQFEARITGGPARLLQAAVGDAPAVSASAGTIVYDTQAAVVALSDGAQLERGPDRLTGDSIKYDVAARRISASGAGGGQVQIVIQPPAGATEPKKSDDPSKP